MRKHKQVDRLVMVIAAVLASLLMSGPIVAQAPPPPDLLTEKITPEALQRLIDNAGYEWRAGETSVSRMTLEERQGLLGLDKAAEQAWIETYGWRLAIPTRPNYDYPSVVDWRNRNGHDWTTSIKGQGGCGACTAFATAATIESRSKIAQNAPAASPNLSEAQIYFCNGKDCDNNERLGPSAALDLAQDPGVVDEACFQYRDYTLPCALCAGWQSRLTKIYSWSYTDNVQEMKQQLADHGPLVATMAVYQDFDDYQSGIYHYVWGTLRGYHAVSIVGSNDSGRYWIVKNSWGTDWGEGGWFRIAYGEVGIDDGAYMPNLSDSAPPSIAFTDYPALDQWYTTDQQVAWTISDDDAGVRGFSRKWDADPGGGQPAYLGQTDGRIRLSVAGQGQHTLYVRAWDHAGNQTLESIGWWGYDTLPPSNPTTVNPGCQATNGVWQNTCNDPHFTWSGADDYGGIGVDHYEVYWGTDPNGTTGVERETPDYAPGAVDNGSYYLRIRTVDGLGHASGWATVFILRYDGAPPVANLEINKGDSTTNQVTVLLNLSAFDTGSGVKNYRLSNSGGHIWTAWRSYVNQLPWTIPALNGRRVAVALQVQDGVGNVSSTVSDSIMLDLYPPKPSSTHYRICADTVNVAGHPGLTSDNFQLTSSVGEAWSMDGQASHTFHNQSGLLSTMGGCAITTTFPTDYEITRWVIAAGGFFRASNGYRTMDTIGEVAASEYNAFTSTSYRLSSGFWSTITETVPPTVTRPTPYPLPTLTPTPTPGPTPTPQPTNFKILINQGAQYTNKQEVVVSLWAPGITQMQLSNRGVFDEAWERYRVTRTWQLDVSGDYRAPVFVHGRFRNAEGTVYGDYSDSIYYDALAPVGQIHIEGGDTITVLAHLEAEDNLSGVAYMRLSNSQAFTGTKWQPYADSLSWPLEVSHVVYVQYRDWAGNDSPIYGSDGSVHDFEVMCVYLPLVLRQ